MKILVFRDGKIFIHENDFFFSSGIKQQAIVLQILNYKSNKTNTANNDFKNHKKWHELKNYKSWMKMY